MSVDVSLHAKHSSNHGQRPSWSSVAHVSVNCVLRTGHASAMSASPRTPLLIDLLFFSPTDDQARSRYAIRGV